MESLSYSDNYLGYATSEDISSGYGSLGYTEPSEEDIRNELNKAISAEEAVQLSDGTSISWGIHKVSQSSGNLSGSSGNDFIDASGYSYGVSVNTKYGDDLVYGSNHDDWIYGIKGNDSLAGFGGDDKIYAGVGNNLIWGMDGNDTIIGCTGNDTILGHAGNDAISGGGSADWLYGGEGNDSVDGGFGDDSLGGGTGADWLYGGEGNDSLWGCDGGADGQMDVFLYGDSSNGVDVIMDFESGVDGIWVTNASFTKAEIHGNDLWAYVGDSSGIIVKDAVGKDIKFLDASCNGNIQVYHCGQ